MQLYAAIDLRATNSYCAIIDEGQNRVFKKRLPNDLKTILKALEPFQNRLMGIAVKSTYNWY